MEEYELFDQWMVNLIYELDGFTMSKFGLMIGLAKVLGACFCILAVAGEGYKVMSKGQEFDILAILRPFALGLIIMSWGGWISVVSYIPKNLDGYFKSIYNQEKIELVNLKKQRVEYAQNISKKVREKKEAAEEAKYQYRELNFVQKAAAYAKDLLLSLVDKVAALSLFTNSWVNDLFETIFLYICEFLWKFAVYLLFFTQTICKGVLIIFGPITFAASILPIWRDAWSQWLSRFIGVLLYSSVGYLVITFAMQMMQYGVRKDLNVLMAADSSAEALVSYLASSLGTAGLYAISLVVGALGVRMVPEIVTWIIPSNAGHAVNFFMAGITNKISGAAKAALSAGSGGGTPG